MKRVPELDGLRGLAAAAVVVYHLFPKALPEGYLGVSLFFVLSGYLITGIVLDHGSTRGFLRNFYARRGLRIWPPYFLSVAALVACGAGPSTGLGWFLTYTQNTPLSLRLHARQPDFTPSWPAFNHSWTLAVEEQFYLLWPAALLVVGAVGVQRLAWLGLATSVVMRGAGLSPHTLIGCLDGLAAGGLLASRRRLGRPDRAGAWAVVGVALWLVCRYPPGAWVGPKVLRGAGGLAVALVFYSAVAWASRHPGTRWTAPLRWGLLTRLGTVSYGVYLYHIPVAVFWASNREWLADRIGVRAPFDVPTGVAVIPLTLLLAAASWRLVERPALAWKGRFEYQAKRVVLAPRFARQRRRGRRVEAEAVLGSD
jgi:peptidoglycan/LPS O-acetylase OafA/YrhL